MQLECLGCQGPSGLRKDQATDCKAETVHSTWVSGPVGGHVPPKVSLPSPDSQSDPGAQIQLTLLCRLGNMFWIGTLISNLLWITSDAVQISHIPEKI